METWALVIDWIGNEFADAVTRVVQEDCHRHGRSLVVLTLGSLSYHLDEAALDAHVRPFLNSPRLDRVLLSAGQIVRGGGGDKLAAILRRSPRRPCLTMGAAIAGAPQWQVNHDGAFRGLLDHLWQVHRYRRYAWIGGPDDNPVARRRRAVFLQFLDDHGAALRPELDRPGDFNLSAGRDAGTELLPLVGSFDVAVAANDSMAIGVREVLGGSVPVTGFDNHPSASLAGISTVDSQLDQEVLGALGCLQALDAEAVDAPGPPPDLGRLVLRSSCGCAWQSTEPKVMIDVAGSSTERVGPLFEAILDSHDLAEVAARLNHALPSENIGFWKILPAEERSETHPGVLPFWPDGADQGPLAMVVHSLFREEELFGYLVHDLGNRNYTLSEWIRINLSLTFHAWHRQSGSLQVQKLLRVEIDRFSRRQKDVETVINSLPVWIVELDRHLQIRYANLAWKSLLTRPTGERAQGAFVDAVVPDDRERVERRLASVLKSKLPASVDFRFRRTGGGTVPVIGEIHHLAEEGGSQLATLFGSLHRGAGLRLVGLDLNPLVEGVLQPDDAVLKHFAFSPREQEMLALLAKGFDSAEMARKMGIRPSTVRVTLHNLYKKTGVTKKRELFELLAEYNSRVPKPQSLTHVLLSRLLRP